MAFPSSVLNGVTERRGTKNQRTRIVRLCRRTFVDACFQAIQLILYLILGNALKSLQSSDGLLVLVCAAVRRYLLEYEDFSEKDKV